MFGIITIALDDKRYIRMAKMLALSLKETNPAVQRAIVSDAPQEEFIGLFDTYIPYDKNDGKGISSKLYLDKYSPFDETFFIDADCLVIKPLDEVITLSRKYKFVVFGGQISSGDWYMDVGAMCKRFELPSLPLFNGGTYYYNDKQLASAIYDRARDLAKDYAELGFTEFRGSINEEPLVSVAMAMNGVEAVDDKGIGMRTPIGIIGPLKVDVLNQKCAFTKEDEYVEPAIIHFAGSHAESFHYKRETLKLRLAAAMPFMNRKIISFTVNAIGNTRYAVFVFAKRVAKRFIRGQKFDFSNPLPMFSNN